MTRNAEVLYTLILKSQPLMLHLVLWPWLLGEVCRIPSLSTLTGHKASIGLELHPTIPNWFEIRDQDSHPTSLCRSISSGSRRIYGSRFCTNQSSSRVFLQRWYGLAINHFSCKRQSLDPAHMASVLLSDQRYSWAVCCIVYPPLAYAPYPQGWSKSRADTTTPTTW